MNPDQNITHSPFAVGSLALAMLLASVGVSIPNVALPTLARVFSASLPEVQWTILAYLLAVTALIVGAGRLGDLLGRRKVLMFGISLFTLSALFCGIAPTLRFLIIARAIQGLGAATLMALTVASVSETVRKEKLGSAMGLLGTMSAVGTATGPTLGGIFITGLGWRSAFLAMVPLGSLALFLMHRYLPASQVSAPFDFCNFDLTGTLFLGLSLTSYALAVTWGGGHWNGNNLALLALAGLFGSLFLWNESQVRFPLFKWEVIRDADILENLFLNGIVSSVMMSTLVVGPFYLSHGLGLKTAWVGLTMSAGPVTSSLTGVLAGKLVDRLGPSTVTIIGLFEMVAGILAMSQLPSILGVFGYIISAVLLSPGYQMFQAANNTSVMSQVTSEQKGVVSGMLSLSRNLGLVTGTALMGTVFSLAAKTTQIGTASKEAVTNGMRVTFSLTAILASIALFISIALLKKETPVSILQILKRLGANL